MSEIWKKGNLSRIEHDPIEQMKFIAGVETKEALIRYIVCDGEPADESCIGHIVLAKRHNDLDFYHELKLINISKFYVLISEPCGSDSRNCIDGCEICSGVWKFPYAKKIPGYDYTKKVEVSDD